ncbi:MAG: HAD family hydrolase [Solibacillus sp.]
MNLFTSDLDRTLIFSERTIDKDEIERICIEQLDGQNISYVTRAIQTRLTEIHENMQFVPVTTRSRAQFERIILFQRDIVPEIAVVANGGMILRNGEVDAVWQAHIEQTLQSLPLQVDDLQQHFHEQLAAPYFLRHQRVDGLFFVYIVDLAQLDEAALQALREQLAQLGWDSYLHGRKFYIVPHSITKGAAVRYLKEQAEYERHYAAGDSLMDVSMMYLADRSFAPLHGEIVEHPESYRQIEIIEKKGAAFAEQCLGEILSSFSRKSSVL